jgi:hypothetical protein
MAHASPFNDGLKCFIENKADEAIAFFGIWNCLKKKRQLIKRIIS